MTTHRTRPKVARESSNGPQHRVARPGLGVALCAVVAAIFVLSALFTDAPLARWAFVSFAVAFSLFGWYVRELAHAQALGFVRVADSGALRFAPSRTLELLPLVIATLALLPGVLQIVATLGGSSFGSRGGSVWLTLASAAGLVWLVQQLWSLRLPTGLSVTAEGLTGVRGGGKLNASWADITDVSLLRGANGDKLHLITSNGSLAQISAAAIGSDPGVVAAVVKHFHAFPAARSSLVDGARAIRAVEDHQGHTPPLTY